MKKHLLPFTLLLALGFQQLQAQDTFSIVAVDTVNGWVGTAGASCLDKSAIAGGVAIIGDVFPGRGAINTQAQWLSANQVTARNRMNAGDSPKEIIKYVTENDATNDSTIRQYGVVDYTTNKTPRSAGYTGKSCLNYKNHIEGKFYCIQGNILLGQQILDSMEVCFLRTKGTLADKLMAALQGAKVVGADTRCAPKNVSSLSAFMKVAKPTDTYGKPSISLIVDKTRTNYDPIDSLQKIYDAWKLLGVNNLHQAKASIRIYPNPTEGQFMLNVNTNQAAELRIYNVIGELVYEAAITSPQTTIDLTDTSNGIYLLQIITHTGVIQTKVIKQ